MGNRTDTVFNEKVGGYVPVLVPETYQYVSLIKILTPVLSNYEVKQAIESEQQFSPDGILGKSTDGQYFKNHPFFSRFRYAIRIKL